MIRISRNQSRIVAAMVLLIFTAAGVLLVRQNAEENQLSLTNLITNDPQELATGFTLNNFHRTETRGGKKVWEVTANKGQYFADSDSAKLSNALITLYQKNGDIIKIEANTALLEFDDNILRVAHLYDSVKMNINDERYVTTQKADYFKDGEMLIAPGYAKIEDSKMILEGEAMTVSLSNNTLKFDKNVRTQIKIVADTDLKKSGV